MAAITSSLYRTFKSNYIPYYANGNGRDRYILYDNAGFFRNIPKINPINIYKTGSSFGFGLTHRSNKEQYAKAPNFRYYANGTGRDRYILANNGGLIYETKSLKSYKLTDFLRKDENKINSNSMKKRVILSKAEILYNKLIKKKEREVVKRLYENDKNKIMHRNRTVLDLIRNRKFLENKNNINLASRCRINDDNKNNLFNTRNGVIKFYEKSPNDKNIKNRSVIVSYRNKGNFNTSKNNTNNKLILSVTSRTSRGLYNNKNKNNTIQILQRNIKKFNNNKIKKNSSL